MYLSSKGADAHRMKHMDRSYRQAKILVLGGSFDQVPYIKDLKSRGFWVALTDLNETAPGKEHSDEFAAIGYEDTRELVAFAASIGLKPGDYVFTAAAQFAHLGAAVVAEACDIEYPKPSTIEMCLDKTRYYQEFQRFGIPIPITKYVSDADDLKEIAESSEIPKNYYLKSDFSKNPRYVYRFNSLGLNSGEFFWGRDRYLRRQYVLQEEAEGRHLRLNIFPGGHTLFDFANGACLSANESEKILGDKAIEESLGKFLNYHQLSSWLVKFDLVVNESEWFALDIGLDPPMRMKSHLEANGCNFIADYLDLYLGQRFKRGSGQL